MKRPDPQQVATHDEVTHTLIIGILAIIGAAALEAGDYVRAADEIMATIKRRGYEPQIRSVNQLRNGRYV